MNATKTSMCMLLAAAIGSAATATTLWDMQRRDPLYQLTRSPHARESHDLYPTPEQYQVPKQPLPISVMDRMVNYYEEVNDAAITARGESFYIREIVEGQQIAYTTPKSQLNYHKALSALASVKKEGVSLQAVIDNTLGDKNSTLSDGTPIVDYQTSLNLIERAIEYCPSAYQFKVGERP